MKYLPCALALILSTSAAFAGMKEVAPPGLEESEARSAALSKVYAEGSYTFEGDFTREDSNEHFEEADVWFAKAGFEQSFPVGPQDWFLKAGVRYTHLGLGETDAFLPDSLQSIAVPIGIEWRKQTGVPLPKFSLTLTPGAYFSEDISSNDFDIPGAIAYGFDLSDDLRLYVGAFGGLMNKYPVLPGGGVAWRFHRGGLLSVTFPQGGIFIFPSEEWEIFAGGEWFSQTHRTDDDAEAPGPLQDALLSYREIRAGVGIKYKPTRNFSVGVSGGYTVDREWDYERAGYTLEQENAPYVKATFDLRF